MFPRLLTLWCVLLAAAAGLAAWSLLRGALPLDDAYIYLQYARVAADGMPFRYAPTEPLSSGATSLAWFAVQGVLAVGVPEALRIDGVLVVHALLVAATFLLAARLCRHLGVPAVAAWLPAGLCLLQPRWFLGAFNGMETALFGVALLLAARVWYGASVGWLALLPLVRPEGLIAAAAVLAHRWWLTSDRAAFAARALPVLLVGTLAAAWPWLVTGLPAAAWSAKALLLEPHPEVASFYRTHLPYFAGRSLLFGLSGSRPQPPLDLADDWFSRDAIGAWVWAVFLGAAVVLAARHRRGRAPVVLWMAGTLTCLSTNAWDAQHYRYLVGALPLLAVVGITGWFGRGTRPATRLTGVVLLLLVVGTTVMASPGLGHQWRWLLRGNAERVRVAQLHAGDRVAGLPENARVATHDVGAIAWEGRRPVVDLVGLVTPALGGAYRHGTGVLWETLSRVPPGERPTHAAIVPSWRPYLYRTLWFDRNLATNSPRRNPSSREFEIWSLSWPDTGLSAPFQDQPVEAIFATGTRWLALDDLDVAHLDAERSHSWSQDLKPWLGTRDELTVVRDLGFRDPRIPASVHAIEGGRRIPARVEFQLEARPGRPARLVLRLTASTAAPLKIWVGGWETTLPVPASENRFHEAALSLPVDQLERALVRGPGDPAGMIPIRLEGAGCVLYHAWLLQPAVASR